MRSDGYYLALSASKLAAATRSAGCSEDGRAAPLYRKKGNVEGSANRIERGKENDEKEEGSYLGRYQS